MIVGLAVAALYGELLRDPWRIRIRQLALMAALAVLANWVRVYTIIQAGYLTNMQSYLVRVSHYGFGWCVFAVALFAFFWLVPLVGPAVESAPAGAAAPLAQPFSVRSEAAALMVVVAILAVLPLASTLLRLVHAAVPPGAAVTQAADPSASWQAAPEDAGSPWRPVFAQADLLQQQAFRNAAGDTVEVLAVAYGVQRQDAKLVGAGSSLLGDGLEARAERVASSSRGAFRETEVVDATGARSLIWWRFDVAGRTLLRPFGEQLWYGINAVIWRPPASLIALRSACRADCDSARRTLAEFVASGAR
jgi:exosortase/archaeosortase family protein